MALNCARYQSREDIVRLAERLAEIPGLTLAQPGLVDTGRGPRRHVPFPGSPRELIHGIYKIIEVRPEDRLMNAYGPEAVNFWGIYGSSRGDPQNQPHRPLEVYLANTMHTRRYSEASATCTVSPNLRIPLEEVAQILSRIARAFYDTLHPHLVWVSYPPSFARLAGEDVLALRLHELHWLNLLGKPYVEKFGRQVLLAAPVFHTESLEGGGISLQLGQQFTNPQSGPPPAEVLKYFRPLGVRYLTWPTEIRNAPT